MKNKNILLFIGALLGWMICLGSNLFAQNYEAKVTYHLVDDSNRPLVNFPYGMGAVIINGVTTTAPDVYGLTDQNGKITLTCLAATGPLNSGSKPGFPGYYQSYYETSITNVVAGKWQPWNPTVEVVVKPIINPIPMYAKTVYASSGYYMTIPATNTPVGFDLEAGDWVAPYGKGSVSDFIFTMQIKTPYGSMTQPYDVIWTLSFSNKGDGVQSVLVPKNVGSAFRLPRLAPETGYQPTLVQEISYDGKQWKKGAVGEDQNYFFRVRTVQDDQGNIKSALYGKIAGPIECAQIGRILFTYYLNPTPNDQNMEFDPSKNLFKNLSDLQQVNAP
jgi:hypothetical protein